MLAVCFMLFSLFFGAGNLIFPPFLGQNAGNHTIWAMLGFLATAVILPVLGVIVVARFDGLDQLAKHAGIVAGGILATVYMMLSYMGMCSSGVYAIQENGAWTLRYIVYQ